VHADRDSSAEYRFGELLLNTATHEVSIGGEPVDLPPLSFRFLHVLASFAPAVVSHDVLIELVWSGRVVSPETVTQRAKLVRQALGDDAHSPKYIGMVRGAGYRLLSSTPESGTKHGMWAATPRRTRVLTAGAVFGLALVVSAAALRPPSPDAAEPRATDDAALAAGTPSTADQHLVLGRFYFYRRSSPSDLELARQHYQAALEIDSSLAAAWTGLAAVEGVRSRSSTGEIDEASLAAERSALERALELDPDSAEAHARLGWVLEASGDERGAAEHNRRALELAPEDPLVLSKQAFVLFWAGELDSAVDLLRRSVELEPLARSQRQNLVVMLLATGRADEAENELRTARELAPDAPDVMQLSLAYIRLLQRRYEDALQLAKSLPREEDRLAVQAMAYHALDRAEPMAACIEQLRSAAGPLAAVRLAEAQAYAEEVDPGARVFAALRMMAHSSDVSKLELQDAIHDLRFSPFTQDRWRTHGWQSSWEALLASLDTMG